MEDDKKLKERSWQWGPSGLILKRWNVDFNGKKDPHNIQQIWVILLGLPMIFRQSKIFQEIGNKLGRFIAIDENWEDKFDRRCSKILVEMNMKHGLFE